MDEFFGLLPVLIIYLVAAFSGKKRNKQKRHMRVPIRSAAHGEQTDMRNSLRDTQTVKGFEAAFEGREKDAPLQLETDCNMRRMHLHEPSQMQMERSGEGEDPCHAGRADAAKEETAVSAYDVQDEQNERQLAHDILRGVVMSEILKRPCDRYSGYMKMQRGR